MVKCKRNYSWGSDGFFFFFFSVILYIFVMLTVRSVFCLHTASLNDLVVFNNNLHELSVCQHISHVLVTGCAMRNQASFICLLLYISCSTAKAGSQISKTNQTSKVTLVIHNSWAPVVWLGSALHGRSVSVCVYLINQRNTHSEKKNYVGICILFLWFISFIITKGSLRNSCPSNNDVISIMRRKGKGASLISTISFIFLHIPHC